MMWKNLMILGCILTGLFGEHDDKRQQLVQPKQPLAEIAGPSDKVTNGVAFESGVLAMPEGHELVLPANAVVEEYDGSTIRFYLTKYLNCLGQPPAPIRISSARHFLGIACQTHDTACTVSTFGEWQNSGGVANLRLLVLVPRGQKWRSGEGLSGANSRACKPMNLEDPKLEACYWYAGIGAKKTWQLVPTELNYNRFLNP